MQRAYYNSYNKNFGFTCTFNEYKICLRECVRDALFQIQFCLRQERSLKLPNISRKFRSTITPLCSVCGIFIFQSNLINVFFNLPFPCRILFLTTSKSNALLNTSSLFLLKTCPFYSPSPVSFRSIKHTSYKFLASTVLNQLNSTYSSYHCCFSSSQSCHLILPKTPCLAPIQHCRSYQL